MLTVASDAFPAELPIHLTGQGLATTDVTVSATSRAVVATGRDLPISVVVQNLGPDAAPSVGVSAFLPGELQSLTAPPGVMCTPPPPGIQFMGCELGSLASGASVTIEVTITVLAPAKSTTVTEWNLFVGGTFDPDVANNTSRQDIRVVGKPA